MALSESSVTAARTATYRAQHQVLDEAGMRVFEDPYAIPLLGDAAVESVSAPPEESRRRSGMRSFLATRARYAEDKLAAAVASGTGTYVVLGAGLDTFALRNPFPSLKVVEVDHPATQAWKKARYAKASIALPAGLSFVPVDFTTDDLAAKLAEHVHDDHAFVSWLGVSYYLHRDALDATFAAVSALAERGSVELVLDYAQTAAHLDALSARYLEIVMQRVAADGEPFVSLFAPHELAALVETHGFRVLQNTPYADVFEALTGREAPPPRGFGALAHLRIG